MIATVFGLITALAVAAWGSRWYLDERQHEEPSSSRRAMRRLMQLPPLLPLEAAEQIMQRQKPPVEGTPAPPPVSVTVEDEPAQPGVTPDVPAVSEDAPPEMVAILDETGAAPAAEPAALPAEPLPAEEPISGYCARCRAKRYLTDIRYTRTGQGKPAIRGSCVICGSGMLVFTSEQAWQRQKAAERDADAS